MAASRITTPPDLRDELPAVATGVLAKLALPRDARLCVALSGGVDSVVLLHVLSALQPRLGFHLSAAHVNHGLSDNAERWAMFCREWCEGLGVPLEVFTVSVQARGRGVEAAAREARLQKLRRVAADWLVFAHHQNDQAETVLFRLLRGAGVRGAAGMVAIEPGAPGVARPFLEVPRERIVRYARACGLRWVEDESNADCRFARNFLRHEIFPRLREVFPGGNATLARAAEHFRESELLLRELAEMDGRHCGQGGLWRQACLHTLGQARLRNLIRWRLECLQVPAPARKRLDEVVRQLQCGQEPLCQRLSGDWVVFRYRGQVWIEKHDGQAAMPPGKALPGRDGAAVVWAGGRLELAARRGCGLSRAALARSCEPLHVRGRWPGLHMSPGQGRPARSFKKLCQEAGVPPWLRERVPVLCVGNEPVWIAGVGAAGQWVCAPGEPGLEPVWWPHGEACGEEP